MRKIIALFLAAVLIFSLGACSGDSSSESTASTVQTQAPAVESTMPQKTAPVEETEPPKSQAVLDAEALIDAIGEVTADSEEAISAAEEAYKALSSEEKAKVENADILSDARDAFDQISLAQKADEVEALIAAASTTDQVLEAIRAYKDCSSSVQAQVENIDVLRNSASTIANSMMAGFAVEEDFVRGYNFYYPSAFPRGDSYWYADQGCFVLPYMGKDITNGEVWLRLVCNYNAWDWIFFEKITYAADSERFYDYFSYYDVVRDNSGGEVWEYVDIDVYDSEIEMLWAIANSTTAIVRFEGDNYYYDYTVTPEQKESIRTMLIVFELLNF